MLNVPPPDLEARYEILRVHTRKMNVASDVDLRQLAKDTELFTGAELEALCLEAGIVALREDISAEVVCNRHFRIVRNSLIKSSPKQNSRCSNNFWGSKSIFTIGFMSSILLAGCKYFLMHSGEIRTGLAVT